jgi:hypothetical protein
MTKEFRIRLLTYFAFLFLSACGNSETNTLNESIQFKVATHDLKALEDLQKSGTCSLENVVTKADGSSNFGDKNNYLVRDGVEYRLIGFSFLQSSMRVPNSMKIILVGSKIYSLDVIGGLERKDVGRYFKNSNLDNSGYQLDAGFNNVNPGKYDVIFINDGVYCPTHQTISVR